jgi:hypothetical protein
VRERVLNRLRDRLGPRPEDAERIAWLEQRLDHERLFPQLWANRRVRDRLGNAVQAGPFAGLAFPDDGIDSVDLYAAKVLGAFEQELHPAVEAAIEAGPRVVVNIGAAEGFYAVGLARRLPNARVIAFEANADRFPLFESVAAVNGVRDRIELHGTCDTGALARVLEPGALVVCDCDGCEAALLDPEAVPDLRTAALIVETHDEIVREPLADRLREAFAPTHRVEAVVSRQRFVSEFPQLGDIPLVTRQIAIMEYRDGPQTWLVMTPKDAAAAPADGTAAA